MLDVATGADRGVLVLLRFAGSGRKVLEIDPQAARAGRSAALAERSHRRVAEASNNLRGAK